LKQSSIDEDHAGIGYITSSKLLTYNEFFFTALLYHHHFFGVFISCGNHTTSENERSEEPFFEIQHHFDDERFPNVVVATDGAVVATFDGGKSWPVSRLVDDGPFAYSSLAAGRPGTPGEALIYLLYESSSGANIARFNLSWITDGRDWNDFIQDE